jgi:prefoldin subunit 5
MWKVLLSGTALAAGVGLCALAQEPVRAGALAAYAYVAPERACTSDPVACLARKGDELARMDADFTSAIRALLADRQKTAAELDVRQRELKANQRLLSEGRELWQDYSNRGRRVRWRGFSYRPEQMEAQLRLLYREHTVLQSTVENLTKVLAELDGRLIDTRVVATRISTERGMMSGKIALVRSGQLAANLDRITADVDRLVSEAEAALSKPAVLDALRTTRELSAARELSEPTAFDRWLREGLT